MSGRSAGMVLLGIIALGGLGLSGYMFLKYEFLSPITPTKDSGLILVGLWNNLDKNIDYAPWDSDDDWLVEFRDSPLNDSNYISVDNGNTRFALIRAGFYKITLKILLWNLAFGDAFYVHLRRNGVYESTFDYFSKSDHPGTTSYQVLSSLYIYSNGLDSFTINCYSLFDPSFTGGGDSQLSIEYVLQ